MNRQEEKIRTKDIPGLGYLYGTGGQGDQEGHIRDRSAGELFS